MRTEFKATGWSGGFAVGACLYLRLEKYKLLISVVILDVVLRLDILLRLGRFEKSDDYVGFMICVARRF